MNVSYGFTVPIEKVWMDMVFKLMLAENLIVLHWACGVPAEDNFDVQSFVADLGNIKGRPPPNLRGYRDSPLCGRIAGSCERVNLPNLTGTSHVHEYWQR